MNRCLALRGTGVGLPLCLVSRRDNGNTEPCQEWIVYTVYVHPPAPLGNELVNSPEWKEQKKIDEFLYCACWTDKKLYRKLIKSTWGNINGLTVLMGFLNCWLSFWHSLVWMKIYISDITVTHIAFIFVLSLFYE